MCGLPNGRAVRRGVAGGRLGAGRGPRRPPLPPSRRPAPPPRRPAPPPAARPPPRAGVPAHLATFLAATPAPARGWLAAVGVVLAFAVAAAHLAGQDPSWAAHAPVPFLTIAPVLPLAGIALAYGPH